MAADAIETKTPLFPHAADRPSIEPFVISAAEVIAAERIAIDTVAA